MGKSTAWKVICGYLPMAFRSPLNVVHAGLDLLLAEVRSADPESPYVSITRSTADFIVHMFTSSESAINILNDLLQYEHMEAGTERVHVHTHAVPVAVAVTVLSSGKV